VSVSIGLLKIWEYGKGIRFGSYYEFVGISLIITFLISLFLHGRAFLLEWKKSAVEAERYQKESVVAHYENLKSQVNPHFLFNSLNVLSNLVYTDQDKAALFIKKMSEVYRYVLDMQGRELVHLSEELAFTESYIFLQKIRFGENLQINNQLTIKSGKVVPLAIQMLIENAIKHNEISSDKPLNISLQYTKPYIKVENEIHLRSNPLKDSSGIGLENIKKRYEFLSSNKVEVLNQGNQFIVRIPLIPEEE
jgi:LytS/YehU family sensor histidine kinase